MVAQAYRHAEPDADASFGTLFGPRTQVVDGIEYAWNDCVPIPVSRSHKDRCWEAFHPLVNEFRSRPGGALVTENLNVYYDPQRPRLAVDPDIMVAVGVPDRYGNRNRYRVWEEGRPPSFVLEVVSHVTWRVDLSVKKKTYARMGVREYFVLDDDSERMPPPRLQGFRLREQAADAPSYEPMTPWSKAECARRRAELGYWCETLNLGIVLRPGVEGVRFYDPTTDDYLATAEEDHIGHAQERARADEAQARADEAQARANQAQARADEARELRLQAQARADKEEARLREALARAAELERRLASP